MRHFSKESYKITRYELTEMQPVIALIAAFAIFMCPASTRAHGARSTSTCSWSQCAVALSPAALECIPAAAELGVDLMIDAVCLAAGGYDVVDAPGVCNGCFSITTNSQGSVLGSIESTISSIAHKLGL